MVELLQVSRIPEDALSAITAQVLQGLSYLHRYKHTVRCSIPVLHHQRHLHP